MLFDDLVNEYRLYRRDEVSREKFINFANAEISVVATRALAHASQDSVLALVRRHGGHREDPADRKG